MQYDDEYDDSYDELNFSVDTSATTNEGASAKNASNTDSAHPQKGQTGRLRSFWMLDGKVYQYPKPGATEIKARSQEEVAAMVAKKAAEV